VNNRDQALELNPHQGLADGLADMGGVDGFTIDVSDGVNTVAATIIVNVGWPAVTTAAPALDVSR